MATDMLTALDGPTTLTVKGIAYTFPIWTTKELLPILSRLREERLTALRAFIKEYNVKPNDAAFTLYQEQIKPLNPYDAHVYFCSAVGVDECLIKSLVKGGQTQEVAEQVVNGLRFDQKQDLSVQVAGIYEYRPEPPVTATTGAKKTAHGVGFGDPGQVPPEVPACFGDAPRPTSPADAAKAS